MFINISELVISNFPFSLVPPFRQLIGKAGKGEVAPLIPA